MIYSAPGPGLLTTPPPRVRQTAGALPNRHRIILLCGRLADPFGDTVGDEIARMLKRDDVRAVTRRFFIADRQHRAAAW